MSRISAMVVWGIVGAIIFGAAGFAFGYLGTGGGGGDVGPLLSLAELTAVGGLVIGGFIGLVRGGNH